MPLNKNLTFTSQGEELTTADSFSRVRKDFTPYQHHKSFRFTVQNYKGSNNSVIYTEDYFSVDNIDWSAAPTVGTTTRDFTRADGSTRVETTTITEVTPTETYYDLINEELLTADNSVISQTVKKLQSQPV